MLDAGREPRTIQHVFSTFRLIWNMARSNKIIFDESPTKQTKTPKFDNRRRRFLTHAEAKALLENLAVRSQQLHDLALLSLHTGMRAGEIFSLIWGNVDLSRGHITIVDPKATETRTAFMTGQIKAMFKKLYGNVKNKNELVFKDRKGKRIVEVSQSFDRAVNDLGLNKGIEDRRQKVVFHSLRHTYASWLVENGVDLYTVSKLMGQSTIKMTERYSHLGENTLQGAVMILEQSINSAEAARTQEVKAAQEGKA
jgi:integrase